MKTPMMKSALAAALLAVPSLLFAGQQLETVKVLGVHGDVTLTDTNGEVVRMEEGATFTEGYTISTGDKSSATVMFSTGSFVAVTSNTEFTVSEFAQESYDASLGSFETLQADPSTSDIVLDVKQGKLLGEVKKISPDSRFLVEASAKDAGMEITGTTWTFSFVGGVMTVDNVGGGVGVFWTDSSMQQYATVSAASKIIIDWDGGAEPVVTISNIGLSDTKAIIAFLLKDLGRVDDNTPGYPNAHIVNPRPVDFVISGSAPVNP